MRRACLFFLVLLIALGSAASAEKIRIGDTVCLLQAAPEKDARKLYILFLGSGDFFSAAQKYADLSAADGLLLIPQGDRRFSTCTAASDRVLDDIRPEVFSLMEKGYEPILIGYSAGGYPASALAVSLAEKGYTGQLYILDGINRNYHGVAFNSAYYTDRLSTWEMTLCASMDKYVEIAKRTRELGEALRGEEFVTFRTFSVNHNGLKAYCKYILSGRELPDSEDD